MLQYASLYCSILQHTSLCCSLLEYASLCCSKLQYTAVYCSILTRRLKSSRWGQNTKNITNKIQGHGNKYIATLKRSKWQKNVIFKTSMLPDNFLDRWKVYLLPCTRGQSAGCGALGRRSHRVRWGIIQKFL